MLSVRLKFSLCVFVMGLLPAMVLCAFSTSHFSRFLYRDEIKNISDVVTLNSVRIDAFVSQSRIGVRSLHSMLTIRKTLSASNAVNAYTTAAQTVAV